MHTCYFVSDDVLSLLATESIGCKRQAARLDNNFYICDQILLIDDETWFQYKETRHFETESFIVFVFLFFNSITASDLLDKTWFEKVCPGFN